MSGHNGSLQHVAKMEGDQNDKQTTTGDGREGGSDHSLVTLWNEGV